MQVYLAISSFAIIVGRQVQMTMSRYSVAVPGSVNRVVASGLIAIEGIEAPQGGAWFDASSHVLF
jgi:hypothetical protein